MTLPKQELLIIATGGQGEPRAALGRIAFGQHELKLAEGDTVIFSSKQIPGNEIAIGRIMNALSDLGSLITDRQGMSMSRGIPAGRSLGRCTAGSGRRSSSLYGGSPCEQARFGHSRGFMRLFSVTATSSAWRPTDRQDRRTGWAAGAGRRCHPSVRRTDHQRAQENCVQRSVAVAVPVDGEGRLAGKIVVRPFGVPIEQDRDDFIADAADAATRAYEPARDIEKLREAVRLAVRRCATLLTGKKPVVEVMLLEVTQ
jgi:ribonuclease J